MVHFVNSLFFVKETSKMSEFGKKKYAGGRPISARAWNTKLKGGASQIPTKYEPVPFIHLEEHIFQGSITDVSIRNIPRFEALLEIAIHF